MHFGAALLLAAAILCTAAAGPAFTLPVPDTAVYYRPANNSLFNITDFNEFLYSSSATAAQWVKIPSGTYHADPAVIDNLGHWNLHNMVIDMRNVTLWLTNPGTISYWDVETNLTIVGLTLWTHNELWTQGVVTAAANNSDGTVQVTVTTDAGYNHSIWFDGVPPIQPLRFMKSNMVALAGCQNLWATNGQYMDLGNNQVTFSVMPDQNCSASMIRVNRRFAKNTALSWPLIIQEFSQINWMDCRSNMYWDSYGGSFPVYTNVSIINAPRPAGATVRRSHPATAEVQGWGYPATGSWYYLGFNDNGRDTEPVIHHAVTQTSANKSDLVSWW